MLNVAVVCEVCAVSADPCNGGMLLSGTLPTRVVTESLLSLTAAGGAAHSCHAVLAQATIFRDHFFQNLRSPFVNSAIVKVYIPR